MSERTSALTIPVDTYNLLRGGAVTFLIVNAFHRVLHPETGAFYTLGEILALSVFSPDAFVFAVILVSLAAGYLILIDTKTYEAALLIAFGVSLVIIMLLLQTPYVTGRDVEHGFVFFDVALRNFAVVVLFTAIAAMSKQKRA